MAGRRISLLLGVVIGGVSAIDTVVYASNTSWGWLARGRDARHSDYSP